MPDIDRDALWQLVGRSMAASASRAPGLVTGFAPGAWRVTCNVNSWTANWIVCHGRDEASRNLIRAALDEAVASSLNTSMVVTADMRDEVVPLFDGLPMKLDGEPPMMWRDARPLPPNPRPYPGEVTQLAASDDLAAALDLCARSFEVDPAGTRLTWAGVLDDPQMRVYVTASDTLDSVCMAYAEGGVTYIYLMATDPDRQRRGAGRAVLTHAMNEAIAEGAGQFFLMASSAGQPLYRALGYETYELPEFWEIHPLDRA
jgi:ribosomal protein S18 acetylase RimI-like enzyme